MFRLWRRVSWLIRAGAVPVVLLTATPGRSPAQSTAPTQAIRYPPPPQLLFPADRSNITLPTPVFQWTPVTGVDNASYRFRLVAIIGNQTPREALESDRPVLEANLYQQTTLLYSAAAYPLRSGQCYAWQVQAITVQGSDLESIAVPVGNNEGRSRIYTFCYRPPESAALTPATALSRRESVERAGDTAFGIGIDARDGNGLASEMAGLSRGWYPAAAGGMTATGSITAFGELYNLTGTGGTAARPDQTGRLQVNTTLGFANGQVQVPLQALLSTDQVSFRQNINQIGISPTWRDYTLHAGQYTPRFTDLTLGDATLLGGGLEGHPGQLRFDAGYGRARRAILPAPGQLVQPEFARWMGIGRLGWQAPSGLLLEASVVQASDRENSLGAAGSTTTALPQDNVVFGIHGKVPFAARRLWLEVEGDRSSYRADTRTGLAAVNGTAGSAALSWEVPEGSAGAKVTYVGPDYRALGNTQLQSDQVRYEATGQWHRGTVSLGLQAGVQQDNLDNDLPSTTKVRGIYSFTASWQASSVFGVDGSASNVVSDIQSADPLLALKNVNASYVLTPRLTWHTGTAQQALVASGTWQTADNTSPGIPGLQDTRTGSGMLAYTLTFASGDVVQRHRDRDRSEGRRDQHQPDHDLSGAIVPGLRRSTAVDAGRAMDLERRLRNRRRPRDLSPGQRVVHGHPAPAAHLPVLAPALRFR